MFNQLRQGSQVYIIHLTATPFIEMGTIESIPNMSIMGYYPNLPSFPMDITIRQGEKTIPYRGLPANAESAKVSNSTSGEEVIIACTKTAVNNELQTLRQASIDILNSISYHEQRIKALDALVAQLNPEVAEKAQREQEICDLKTQLSDMRQMMAQLTAQLNKETSSSSTKSRKEQ